VCLVRGILRRRCKSCQEYYVSITTFASDAAYTFCVQQLRGPNLTENSPLLIWMSEHCQNLRGDRTGAEAAAATATAADRSKRANHDHTMCVFKAGSALTFIFSAYTCNNLGVYPSARRTIVSNLLTLRGTGSLPRRWWVWGRSSRSCFARTFPAKTPD